MAQPTPFPTPILLLSLAQALNNAVEVAKQLFPSIVSPRMNYDNVDVEVRQRLDVLAPHLHHLNPTFSSHRFVSSSSSHIIIIVIVLTQ